jgi:hypothetical protein
MPKSREQLLAELKRNKANRSVADVEAVLAAYGWSCRPSSKEGNVWSKGSRTLTLPKPHGGDKVMKIPYVVMVIRHIEEQEAVDLSGETNEDA